MSRSVDWIRRQARDPYVRERILRGFNSRSAFKLEQLDEKLKFIGRNKKTVDLGAFPGGWCQVLLGRGVKDIIALDLQPPPTALLDRVIYIQGDFTDEKVRKICVQELGNKKAVRARDMFFLSQYKLKVFIYRI